MLPYPGSVLNWPKKGWLDQMKFLRERAAAKQEQEQYDNLPLFAVLAVEETARQQREQGAARE